MDCNYLTNRVDFITIARPDVMNKRINETFWTYKIFFEVMRYVVYENLLGQNSNWILQALFLRRPGFTSFGPCLTELKMCTNNTLIEEEKIPSVIS